MTPRETTSSKSTARGRGSDAHEPEPPKRRRERTAKPSSSDLPATMRSVASTNGAGADSQQARDRAARRAADDLRRQWETDPRWHGIERLYSAEDVVRLRGSIQEEHTLARLGAERLWQLLQTEDYIRALGALTGNQAVQQVKAGLQAIYLSGWQVAADANMSGQTYPDQSLYPANSVPQVVRRINNALLRADQISVSESLRHLGNGKADAPANQNGSAPYWLAPIVADAEAGFGGVLNAYELMKAMIAAGAAGVHWEDQLASEKKCGHLGGKVLIPTGQHIRTLSAARLAADVCGVPSLVIARTDAHAATLVTSDVDERDREFVTGERTAEGYYRVRNGLAACIARGLAYSPHSELLWMETSTPDLEVARKFAEAIKAEYPDQMLAYNCSPSFNWKQHLDDDTIAAFQRELGAMGYAFQFITLAGFHALNQSMFDLARGYAESGMPAYVALQEREFAAEPDGYTATRHQREVGTGYFDLVSTAISPDSSTTALTGSTEEEQFKNTA
ncbi:isocitrate lyase [Actinopolymorpha sp. B11F2]|uniref:isocitrate lyase n=1 Tax=Actinopolymorpha sp. B11F2 TaxID=3160862 RepID=UPI0032E3694B